MSPSTEDLRAESPQSGWKRGFWMLIATQFQGALNEQGLKQLIVFLVMGMVLRDAEKDRLVLVIGALFAIPYILFSMSGGFLADRYSKRSVTIATKVFEAGVMLLAMAGLARHNLSLEFAAVFLASTQAAIFGPSKYGLLPEILPKPLLSWGNGIIELGTFLGVIAGAGIAGVMATGFGDRQTWSGGVFLGLSVIGLVCSLGVSRVPAAAPDKKFVANPLADLLAQTSLLLVALSVGIGLGSVAAGYLSGGKVEYGLIPLGAMGLSICGILLSLHGLGFVQVAGLLAALGLFAGFFAVPINALIQHRPDEENKGGVIAAANWISWIGIGVATAIYFVLRDSLHMGPPAIFLVASVATLAGTAYVTYLVPDSLLRLLFWMVTHTLYRIHIEGRENIPDKGGALLAPNHISMVDAALLIASTERPVRFLMFKDNYEHPLIKPFARIMGVIPISSDQGPREMIHSLRAATDALKNGEIVCIFPEGQMTRIGQMLPFRRGMERIVKGADVPIIPVYLGGVWGSIFSFERGRFLWKMPRRIPYPVTVLFGNPMPATTSAQEVRHAVQELGAQVERTRTRHLRPLQRSFVSTARRHPFRFAMADGNTPHIRFHSVLARTIFVARRLRAEWRDQQMVGILLPPSIAGALVNLAALLMGKTPVNLNYTASSEILASCASQCGLQTIISSKVFLERVRLQLPGRAVLHVVLMEELVQNPRLTERLLAAAMSWLPVRLLERALGSSRKPQLDDVATVIFSSGSTGVPKGVLLTHANIASNVEQLNQVFMLGRHDRILGILPFFHSFGFTGTLCMPVALGLGVVFHASPLEARAIGALVSRYAVTFLLATPTFLQGYIRRCSAEDFGSLKYVMTGAEKLPERIAVAFEDHFGIRPMEGYGCTECSPVVAVNTRDFRAAKFRQVGAKRGSIGHPLPGISIRIVDPDTGAPLPLGQPGLLLVCGPNVMQGYLNHPEKTAEVLRDGWYNTGDIAQEDEDGFIRITDRLSRFSKIGGEMVPHIKVEDQLQEIAAIAEQVFAVTSVPDDKKGEKLIVLHTLSAEKLQECVTGLSQSSLPALWRPRADQFLHVEALPYLGTGKLDLRRIREVALKGSKAGSE